MGAYNGYVRGGNSVEYVYVHSLVAVPPVAVLHTHLRRLMRLF